MERGEWILTDAMWTEGDNEDGIDYQMVDSIKIGGKSVTA